MPLIGYCKYRFYHKRIQSNFDSHSDRFRTAINVFGDSIGCAIVQHLSRHELQALSEKQIFIEENNPNGTVALLVPNDTIIPLSNPMGSVAYNNPTFLPESRTLPIDENSTMGKTYF